MNHQAPDAPVSEIDAQAKFGLLLQAMRGATISDCIRALAMRTIEEKETLKWATQPPK